MASLVHYIAALFHASPCLVGTAWLFLTATNYRTSSPLSPKDPSGSFNMFLSRWSLLISDQSPTVLLSHGGPI